MNNSKIIDGEELKGKIGAFTQYLIDEEKSNSTIEGYRRNVKRFIEFIGKSKINKNTVLEYKSALMNMYKTATINAALSAILFAFLKLRSPRDLDRSAFMPTPVPVATAIRSV